MKGKTMGKKKKALLRNKRLGNLGKYAAKFSALLKTATEAVKEKAENTIETKNQEENMVDLITSYGSSELPVAPEPEEVEQEEAPKPTRKRTAKKAAPKKTPTTTRKRRTTKTKTDA
jgi:hypothetical protein